MRTAVVFLVFNRPELTARVFERIRAARPPTLLVVCDGPRATHVKDTDQVNDVRRIVDGGIDWPCEVFRNYSEVNLGCRERVASGLNWAFSIVEEAIILEDDCLPDATFFPFCEELLFRYRTDASIMHIGGTNLAAPHMASRQSYWFSHHPWIWGWATWRRAWKHYDLKMNTWHEREARLALSFASAWEKQYWWSTLDHARQHPDEVNTWDFSWNYTCRSLGAYGILPTKNLIENLGFGGDATHTKAEMARLHLPADQCDVLRHPETVGPQWYYDELLTRIYADAPLDWISNLKSRLRICRHRRGLSADANRSASA